MPSASVSTGPSAIAPPAYGAHASACTPITLTVGRIDLTAIATPQISPPPPKGTITVSRSPMSSSSSRPSVPWPATTAGSSKGEQNAMPELAARSCAAATAALRSAPNSTTFAPCRRDASILVIGAPTGTKISHGTPKCSAANARAWAWLPALPVVTPRAASLPSAASLFMAPRILNDPVRWRFSALSTTLPPMSSDSVREVSTGVCFATDPTTARAVSIASKPTVSSTSAP